MRIFLVLFIFGMITSVVPTRFNITGTIKCQNAPPWCYTVQLQVLDSILNDVIGSMSACELKNRAQNFHFESWQRWGGVFDEQFELELLITHDCGIEIANEKQSLSLSFGQFSTMKTQCHSNAHLSHQCTLMSQQCTLGLPGFLGTLGLLRMLGLLESKSI